MAGLLSISKSRCAFLRTTSVATFWPIASKPFTSCTVLREKTDARQEDFYRFTSGRWLRDEEARLRERYKKFNVAGLKQLAAAATGTRSCTSITILAEGGFNRLFSLAMNDDSMLVARIPYLTNTSTLRVMASEVATMDLARNVMGISVPKVLAWDGTTSNSVKSEYMLMEVAGGSQLEELWPDMDLSDKLKIVNDLVMVQEKLQSVSFSSYGSLYFKADRSCSSAEVELSGDLSEAAKIYAKDRFVIGPLAEQAFWQMADAPVSASLGPWPNTRSYLNAIAEVERTKLPSSLQSADDDPPQDATTILHSSQARHSLLDKFHAISHYLPPRDADLDKATLVHSDLRAPNIFVKDGRISSLIDWQGSWIAPFFMQERRPHLVEYHGDVRARLPEYYQNAEDKQEKARLDEQFEKSVLNWYYGLKIEKQNPTLQKLFDLPQAQTRSRAVHYVSGVCNSDTIYLRECLWKLQRNWDELDTSVACPFSFDAKEIEAHHEMAATWNETQDFWDSLSPLTRDGYVPNGFYEAAREMLRGLEDEDLADLKGGELAVLKELKRWAEAWNET